MLLGDAGPCCRADAEQKRHKEHLTMKFMWSIIMGSTIEEIEGHVEGKMVLLWNLIVDFPC
jgi:predicted transposase YbfD/YdcC